MHLLSKQNIISFLIHVLTGSVESLGIDAVLCTALARCDTDFVILFVGVLIPLLIFNPLKKSDTEMDASTVNLYFIFWFLALIAIGIKFHYDETISSVCAFMAGVLTGQLYAETITADWYIKLSYVSGITVFSTCLSYYFILVIGSRFMKRNDDEME
ncbi:MAG TPA: hypothetical protein VD905_16195 [Flavobacteriales bacterium]|nr:hypothetical protein [Flavobacteriales bacterium]